MRNGRSPNEREGILAALAELPGHLIELTRQQMAVALELSGRAGARRSDDAIDKTPDRLFLGRKFWSGRSSAASKCVITDWVTTDMGILLCALKRPVRSPRRPISSPMRCKRFSRIQNAYAAHGYAAKYPCLKDKFDFLIDAITRNDGSRRGVLCVACSNAGKMFSPPVGLLQLLQPTSVHRLRRMFEARFQTFDDPAPAKPARAYKSCVRSLPSRASTVSCCRARTASKANTSRRPRSG